MLSHLVDHDDSRNKDAKQLAGEISNLAKGSSESLREIIWALNHEKKSYDDLTAYMQKQAETFFSSSPLEVLVDVGEGAAELNFSPTLKREILLILKEIMTNVSKHALATEFRLSLRCEDGQFVAEAIDNGVGFDMNETAEDSLGLSSIKDRAERIHARLQVVTSPGNGTRYTLRIGVQR